MLKFRGHWTQGQRKYYASRIIPTLRYEYYSGVSKFPIIIILLTLMNIETPTIFLNLD